MNDLLPKEPTSQLAVSCPKCGSKRIGHVERALVTMQVSQFSRDLFGNIVAVAFAGEPIPDWQTSDAVDLQWQCLDCQQELTDEDLIIEDPTPA